MVSKIIVLLSFIIPFGMVSIAHASPENDRMYALESLSWLKPIDNVDGIFNDYIDEIYEKYFSQQSRFQIKKIGNAGAILSESKIPYYRLAKDPDVLKKISRQFRVESLLRTSIAKEGTSYRFVIEWVYGPRGDILSQNEFRFYDPGTENGLRGSDLAVSVGKALDTVINKLPFLGQITGVEGETLTVNMGRNQGLKEKEILTVFTLQALKRHPLDHTIEEWRWAPVGKAQVTQVEDSLLFAKVIELEPGQTFDRYQKVREILPAPIEETKKTGSKEDRLENLPRLGWVAGGLGIGTYSREVGGPLPSAANGVTSSALMESGQVDAMVWLNSRWIAQGSLGTSLIKFSPKDSSTNASLTSSYSGSATHLRLAVGYAFFPSKTIFDSAGWVHLGYRSSLYSLTANSNMGSGSSSFGSLFIGLGGEVPIADRFAAQVAFDLGLIRSFSQSDLSYGDTGSTADLMLGIGGTYRYTERIFFRVMFNISSQSADFADGHSINQKLFSIMPAVMYYF